MKHGSTSWVEEAAQERGVKVPESIENKPEIELANVFYWDAFWDLDTCRQVGIKVGPIPITACMQYAEHYDVADFETFAYLIQRMDRVFLDFQRKDKKNGRHPDSRNC